MQIPHLVWSKSKTWQRCAVLLGILMLAGCVPEEYGNKICFGPAGDVRLRQNQQRVHSIFESQGFRVHVSSVGAEASHDVVYVPKDCRPDTHCGHYFVVRWDTGRNTMVFAYAQARPIAERDQIMLDAISTRIMKSEDVIVVSPERCGLRLVNDRYAFPVQ